MRTFNTSILHCKQREIEQKYIACRCRSAKLAQWCHEVDARNATFCYCIRAQRIDNSRWFVVEVEFVATAASSRRWLGVHTGRLPGLNVRAGVALIVDLIHKLEIKQAQYFMERNTRSCDLVRVLKCCIEGFSRLPR